MTPFPKVKVLDNSYERIVLDFEDVTPALLNSIRRAAIAEVPTLAIDEVVFYNNDSVMWDEVLAHRLALIPLKITPLEGYDALRDCYNHGNTCAALFILDEEAVERVKTIYSGHLRFEGFEGLVGGPARINVEPVSKKIPIVKLARGQRLRFTAIAKMGVGREHAKWQPTSAVGYRFAANVRVVGEPDEETAKKIAETCPRNVFAVEDGKLVVKNLEACNTCRECQDRFPQHVVVTWDSTKARFTLESVGSLPAWKILITAIDVLEEKAADFVKAVEAAIRGAEPEN